MTYCFMFVMILFLAPAGAFDKKGKEDNFSDLGQVATEAAAKEDEESLIRSVLEAENSGAVPHVGAGNQEKLAKILGVQTSSKALSTSSVSSSK